MTLSLTCTASSDWFLGTSELLAVTSLGADDVTRRQSVPRSPWECRDKPGDSSMRTFARTRAIMFAQIRLQIFCIYHVICRCY